MDRKRVALFLLAAAVWMAAQGLAWGAAPPDGPAPFQRRKSLLEAFTRHDPAQAIPLLKAGLDDEALFVRRSAAHLLARIGEPGRAGIERALANSDFQVRRIAYDALAEMGEFSLDAALEGHPANARDAAFGLLTWIGEPGWEGLEEALEDPASPTRRLTRQTAEAVGEALHYWEMLLLDEHPSIRQEARLQRSLLLEERMALASEAMRERPSLMFDGEGSWVVAGEDVYVGGGDFTYEFWFMPHPPTQATQGLMGTGRGDNPGRLGINVRFTGAGQVLFTAANRRGTMRLSAPAAPSGEPWGQWAHVAVSVERGGKARLFVNGVIRTQTDAAELGEDDGFDVGSFHVGRRPHSNIWHFRGALAEVRVWRKALGQREIAEHMHGALAGDEEGLHLYWPMDEGEGDVAHDKSPNENHGRIVEAAWAGGR